MWHLCVLSSQGEIEDVQNAVCGWQRAGQSTFLHLHHLKSLSAIMKLRLLWFLSSQESFTEGTDLIWRIGDGEFDQVRCKKTQKTKEQRSHLENELMKLTWSQLLFILLFCRQASEASEDEWLQIAEEKKTLEDEPAEEP